MKAIRFHQYGSPDVLRYEEAEEPTCGSGELLVEVHAAGVNPVDWRYRKGQLKWYDWFSYFPRIPGCDWAGEILGVGESVTEFQTGQSVYGMTGPLDTGTYAEKITLDPDEVAVIPDNLSMVEAAGLPLVSLTSLQALRDKAELDAKDHLLINGASGGVGSVALQMARAWGATVTGVCSYRNTDLVETLGADHVIDYTDHDFAENTGRYDIVYDAYGNRTLGKVANALKPGGRFVTTDIRWQRWLEVPFSRLKSGPNASVIVVSPDGEDLREINSLVEQGNLQPVVDRTYPLQEASEAHEYSGTRRASGKIVLEVTSV